MDPSHVVPRVQPGLGSERREGGTSTPLPTPARSEGKITDGVTLALSGVRGGLLGARWTRVGHTCRTGARGTLLRHDSQPWTAQLSLGVKICDPGVRILLFSDLMSKSDLLLEGDSKLSLRQEGRTTVEALVEGAGPGKVWISFKTIFSPWTYVAIHLTPEEEKARGCPKNSDLVKVSETP